MKWNSQPKQQTDPREATIETLHHDTPHYEAPVEPTHATDTEAVTWMNKTSTCIMPRDLDGLMCSPSFSRCVTDHF